MKYTILGKSSYAVAIILDILAQKHPGGGLEVDIVSNIPDEQNDSLAHPFQTHGIITQEYQAEDWEPAASGYLLGSIGKGREKIVQFFEEKFGITTDQYQNIIHPSSIIPYMHQLGKGVHISPQTVIAPFAKLGNFSVLNRNSSVGHHTVLEDFACLNPGVNVAGVCRIGRNVMIGAGASVLDQITIGDGSIIGAGSVVTKDIPAGVVAYGVPAKIVREIG